MASRASYYPQRALRAFVNENNADEWRGGGSHALSCCCSADPQRRVLADERDHAVQVGSVGERDGDIKQDRGSRKLSLLSTEQHI